jgi:hypothetical protein
LPGPNIKNLPIYPEGFFICLFFLNCYLN